MRRGIGRRAFLVGAAAAAAATAVGCSSDAPDRSGDAAGAGPTTTDPAPVEAPEAERVPAIDGDPFTLGVASGDPTTTSVIIWTRLAPDPLADDGAGGMPPEDADVIWEVALDDAFEELVAAGLATTTPAHGHSVHAEVTDLAPGSEAHYRFRYADWTSPVGRTATLPDGSPDTYALAVVNCQMLESGRYGAYRNLVDEDVDLVLHLGDYIYEYPAGDGEGAPRPNKVTETLADYRLRYSSYRLEPNLQAAHARFPFVLTWDDHEVANNYMGDVLPPDRPAGEGRDRKAAAYQGWWEHQPTRLGPPEGSDLAVHQALTIGDLARIHVLDERQDSAVPPCRDDAVSALTDAGDCAARLDEDRTRLGPEQEGWLAASLAEGGVTWNLLGNPVVLAGIDAGTTESSFYLDTWDGFPQARQRLIDQLAEVANPVVLTGDYHAGMVLDVQERPFDATSAVVAPEFMSPPISSILFPADVSGRTPQLRQQLNAHGYLTVTVTPARCTVVFRTVDDVQDVDSAMTTAATWQVDEGDPVAREA